MGWSISPNSATINSNGVASIPKNTGETDITYTITYVDSEGCSGRTTYVKQACPPEPPEPPVECQCSDMTFTKTEIELWFTSDEQSIEVGTSTGNCEIHYVSTQDWVSAYNDGDKIMIKVEENTYQSEEKHCGIDIFANEGHTDHCKHYEIFQTPRVTEYTYTIAVFQNASGGVCNGVSIDIAYNSVLPGPRYPDISNGQVKLDITNCNAGHIYPIVDTLPYVICSCGGSGGDTTSEYPANTKVTGMACDINIGGVNLGNQYVEQGHPKGWIVESGFYTYTLLIKAIQGDPDPTPEPWPGT